MVFAKTSKAASRLSEQVRNKSFKKKYLAIVNGKVEPEEGIMRDYLWKDEKRNMSFVVKEGKKNAKLAELDYEVVSYNKVENLSLLRVNLHTGRHHQIRVQLSSRMYAIYGDSKYHGRGAGTGICLYAYELVIVHPIRREKMVFTNMPEKKGMWKRFI